MKSCPTPAPARSIFVLRSGPRPRDDRKPRHRVHRGTTRFDLVPRETCRGSPTVKSCVGKARPLVATDERGSMRANSCQLMSRVLALAALTSYLQSSPLLPCRAAWPSHATAHTLACLVHTPPAGLVGSPQGSCWSARALAVRFVSTSPRPFDTARAPISNLERHALVVCERDWHRGRSAIPVWMATALSRPMTLPPPMDEVPWRVLGGVWQEQRVGEGKGRCAPVPVAVGLCLVSPTSSYLGAGRSVPQS